MKTTTRVSPLIEGFKIGLLGQNFDTATRESMSPTHRRKISELADRFKVSERTIFRWKRAGVNIEDDLDVASHIAMHGRSAAALKSASELIKKLP